MDVNAITLRTIFVPLESETAGTVAFDAVSRAFRHKAGCHLAERALEPASTSLKRYGWFLQRTDDAVIVAEADMLRCTVSGSLAARVSRCPCSHQPNRGLPGFGHFTIAGSGQARSRLG